jgi:leucyl-tRNA synthetase
METKTARTDFVAVGEKWQKIWAETHLAEAPEFPGKKKYFVMPMFAYPSGDIHIGHFRNFSITDAIARKKMMEGYEVMHPFGWDAFGLPAEQAAIKRGLHPEEWTLGNIAVSKATLQTCGILFDWSREVTSCLPDYYRWTQWLFIQLYNRGLAYRKSATVNWCGHCNTVLANEQAEGDMCWLCHNPVGKRELVQWFFKITDYAERLLAGIDTLEGWPENLRTIQRGWIGRSEGVEIDFVLEGSDLKIPVFTTRPDTIFGVTFMTLAPESPLVGQLGISAERRRAVEEYIEQARNKTEIDRTALTEKDGVFTGRYAINPLNGERVQLWIGDYVLASYGTGAVMAVPGHDERDFDFAKKYGLEIKYVINTGRSDDFYRDKPAADPAYGTMMNSGPFDGAVGREAIHKVIEYCEKQGVGRARTNYKIRDWLISRQRYWGCPIPMVHCDSCGIVPVSETDLPVELPRKGIDFLPTGRSPLADAAEYMNTTCPKCGGAAQRDPDTMDTFMCSSWYFLRYTDPKNDRAIFDPKKATAWLPIDMYVGGIEHATGHLIYFRFFTKFLHDLGLLNIDEPDLRMFNHGMVNDAQGQKMSKSKGNVVSPIDLVRQYGPDPVRLAVLFASPSDKEILWSNAGITGTERFLSRADAFIRAAEFGEQVELDRTFPVEQLHESDRTAYLAYHLALKKIDADFERLQFNTHIAAIMELLNAVPADCGSAMQAHLAGNIVRLLAPLAPHVAEEWWSAVLGRGGSIFATGGWPVLDSAAIAAATVTIVCQVNSKVRAQLTIAPDIGREELEQLALAEPKIQKHLEGKKIRQTIIVPRRLINFVVG